MGGFGEDVLDLDIDYSDLGLTNAFAETSGFTQNPEVTPAVPSPDPAVQDASQSPGDLPVPCPGSPRLDLSFLEDAVQYDAPAPPADLSTLQPTVIQDVIPDVIQNNETVIPDPIFTNEKGEIELADCDSCFDPFSILQMMSCIQFFSLLGSEKDRDYSGKDHFLEGIKSAGLGLGSHTLSQDLETRQQAFVSTPWVDKYDHPTLQDFGSVAHGLWTYVLSGRIDHSFMKQDDKKEWAKIAPAAVLIRKCILSQRYKIDSQQKEMNTLHQTLMRAEFAHQVNSQRTPGSQKAPSVALGARPQPKVIPKVRAPVQKVLKRKIKPEPQDSDLEIVGPEIEIDLTQEDEIEIPAKVSKCEVSKSSDQALPTIKPVLTNKRSKELHLLARKLAKKSFDTRKAPAPAVATPTAKAPAPAVHTAPAPAQAVPVAPGPALAVPSLLSLALIKPTTSSIPTNCYLTPRKPIKKVVKPTLAEKRARVLPKEERAEIKQVLKQKYAKLPDSLEKQILGSKEFRTTNWAWTAEELYKNRAEFIRNIATTGFTEQEEIFRKQLNNSEKFHRCKRNFWHCNEKKIKAFYWSEKEKMRTIAQDNLANALPRNPLCIF